MSVPAPASDSKSAHLLAPDEAGEVEAPPSYAASAAAPKAPAVIGDGNVFSDLPRPGMSMNYGPGQQQPYESWARRSGNGTGTWSNSLFACFGDMGATAKACCCPCVSYGQTRHRLHHPNTDAPLVSTPCLGYCLAGSAMPGSESIFGLLNRSELRERLDIDQPPAPAARPRPVRLPGSPASPAAAGATSARPCGVGSLFENYHAALGFLDDALKHLFCGCCALVQEDREVRLWERQLLEGGCLGDLEAALAHPADGPPDGQRDEPEEDRVREEGEQLLGTERSELRGLRG